jgi:uncharacterized protein YjiS (DUF1127 family)
MAFYDTTRPAAAGRFSRAVSAVLADFHAWNEARLTRRALKALSDRELADIGLQRSDLDAMARRELARY